MEPIFLACTKSFHDGIAPDVVPFLQAFVRMANAMIKVIILPADAVKSRGSPLPVTNGRRHARLRRKANQGMQMIGHQQEQLAPPSAKFVIARN